jgi:hypothetical protein
MFTAKDFQKTLDDNESELGEKVDQWLQTEVLPGYRGAGHGEEVPEWTDTETLVRLLRLRGFDVTSHRGYQGSFVYITVPPQGK